MITSFIIFFLLLGYFIPLSFQSRISAAAQGTQSPTISNAIVNNYQTSLTLPSGAQEYVYGYVTGGAPSSGFAYGQYASVTNAAGNVPAALALTTSNTNSFSTSASYFAIGGASVSGFSSVSSSYGSSGTPSASSASVTFTVSVPGSLVVIVGEAGGGQSISISGIPGLRVDATNFVPPCNQGLPPVMEIASAYPSVGTYTVTEQTSQCAGGQNPNGTGDLIGVFVFTPTSTTSTTTTPSVSGVSSQVPGSNLPLYGGIAAAVIALLLVLLMVTRRRGRKLPPSQQLRPITPEVAQKLQQLKSMLDAGLITQEDYEAQKKRLLE